MNHLAHLSDIGPLDHQQYQADQDDLMSQSVDHEPRMEHEQIATHDMAELGFRPEPEPEADTARRLPNRTDRRPSLARGNHGR
ncbi:hypothetical protein OG288_37175 [Streptomyces tauricus]|uniref:Uncharacterized protein n=1 Tax=Streptomyces tauricus TaxID=68274 RepID=A0ABZ1JP98_9ACTN|nr:hypothetical protein [Streptomyces tauricus]